ncbi:MAG: hypothetical protein JXA97_10585 [Anaerolineales bacterium]|nr:hypothetical protein [Anaerolineales bacterium]
MPGLNLGAAGIAPNATAASILLPAGLILFKKKPSWMNIAGMVACIAELLITIHRS